MKRRRRLLLALVVLLLLVGMPVWWLQRAIPRHKGSLSSHKQ